MPEKKTFILGVGAQKCGTSWLHGYIDADESVDTGMTKEYHVWDALDVPECARFEVGPVESALSQRNRIRRSMQTDPEQYFTYFEQILHQPGITVTADITPSYSALKAPRLSQIFDGFRKRGIDCKVVFLMRDPVERCWSAVRMHRKRGHAREGVALDPDEAKSVLGYYATTDARMRTRYDATIHELEAAIPPDKLYFGLYEELFDSERIDAISGFIGIPPRHDFVTQKFNVSEKLSALPDEVVHAVVDEYRTVYEFCSWRFPPTKTLWVGNRYL